MTERRHTPGPWVARTRANPSKHRQFRVYATKNECHLKGTVRPGDFFIADVWRREDCYLMAAAPELLEALEDVLDGLGFLSGGNHELEGFGIPEERGAEIRAAIAKAKGQDQ